MFLVVVAPEEACVFLATLEAAMAVSVVVPEESAAVVTAT